MTFEIPNDAVRNRLKTPVPLNEILLQALKWREVRPKDQIALLKEKWSEWVGPLLGRKSSPLKIRGKYLIVGTEGPVWASELELSKVEIIKNVQRELNGTPIEEIRFRVLSDRGVKR